MERFERWRDSRYVYAHSFAEWCAIYAAANLSLPHTEDALRESYDFADWTMRMRMPTAKRESLEQWLITAPPRYRDFWAVIVINERVVSLRSTVGSSVARK